MDKIEAINQLFRDAGQLHGWGSEDNWHKVEFYIKVNEDNNITEIARNAKVTPSNRHQEQPPHYVLLIPSITTLGK
jgi:hypothetical protein